MRDNGELTTSVGHTYFFVFRKVQKTLFFILFFVLFFCMFLLYFFWKTYKFVLFFHDFRSLYPVYIKCPRATKKCACGAKTSFLEFSERLPALCTKFFIVVDFQFNSPNPGWDISLTHLILGFLVKNAWGMMRAAGAKFCI